MYDYENRSESELIRRARRGDVKAFARLYSQIYRDLYRFALCVMRHPQEAEDAVSEAVLSAYEHISGLKKEASFRSWMFTILDHQCKKNLSKHRLETTVPGADAYLEAQTAAEPDYAGQQDVRRAFAELDEEERMIVAFSVFGGYPSEEIARLTGRNAATVRSRKSRALAKMRARLQG